MLLSDAFRNKIKAVLPRLMQLVEKNHFKGPVTELISLLAVDDTGSLVLQPVK